MPLDVLARRLGASAAVAAIVGCQPPIGPAVVQDQPSDTGDAVCTVDPTDALYAPDHLLQVEIELDPTDWETLRLQSRNLLELLSGDCLSEPFGSPYTWFEASVTLDGEVFDRVDVRKKGFIGSLSDDKPGLKLDLGEYVDGAEFSGARRLTLNNSVSDSSIVRQCLAYSVFTDAGIPASRCSFAQVSVNGDDMGLYVNVESVKEPMLARHFEDTSGNLYEGTLSDFQDEWAGTFEPKTNEDQTNRADIAAVVDALKADDDELLDELAQVIDMDAFYTFWATEVLVKHQDGYAANTNNFFIYNDPATGRFTFMPWGVDDTLSPYFWEGENSPHSVFANGYLTYRLYQHPVAQQRYLDRLADLLENTWDEEVLNARLDQMQALLTPALRGYEADALEADIAEVRAVVNSRRGDISAELDGSPERWRGGPAEAFCVDEVGSIDVVFDTEWGSLDESFTDFGDASMVLSVDDESLVFETTGSVAGYDDGGFIVIVAGDHADGYELLVYFGLYGTAVAPGRVEIDLVHAAASIYVLEPGGSDYEYQAEVGGTMVLTDAEAVEGGPVVGSLSGGVYVWGG